jgi:hypothetical protein
MRKPQDYKPGRGSVMKSVPSAFHRIVIASLVASGCHGVAQAYNSEEHMLITDQGVSQVVIPEDIVLPQFVGFKKRDASYKAEYTGAKMLAAGFSTNNPKDYKPANRAQDNCYWNNYKQLEYNKKLWVPEDDELPSQVFYVLANTGAAARTMTFGQMVALYGDYRRTTYCNVSGQCYLTDADTAKVEFTGNVIYKGTYCPEAIDSQVYLRHIGAGLVPPFGTAGNVTSNTDKTETKYSEAGWWGDEMLRIANVNDWHFSKAAIAWYVGLHRLALLYVEKAVKEPKYWNQALHYEANALHSLTDLFAFGHVVTNRDETSYGIVTYDKLESSDAYAWMKNVITMGSGERDSGGAVALNGNLPPLADAPAVRNDLLRSYGGTWLARANAERKYHDYFNESGATVRNLNGTLFVIYGDGKMRDTNSDAKQQIAEAVRASVQSVFDAYTLIAKKEKTIEEIGASGSPYFEALKYVPVYIESDKDDYFTGRWTLYAKAVRDLSGSDRTLKDWDKCQIPYLSGKDYVWPESNDHRCAEF